jgi:hypothetical protein
MPNGYQIKKEEWDRMEKPLLAIDSEFERFAKLHALEVTKNYHNWPSRTLNWNKNNAERKLQIYLNDQKTLTFNVCIIPRDVV